LQFIIIPLNTTSIAVFQSHCDRIGLYNSQTGVSNTYAPVNAASCSKSITWIPNKEEIWEGGGL